jgi:hypothetical protein
MIDDGYEYKCSECGSEVERDAKKCPKCGADLENPPDRKESAPAELLTLEWARIVDQKIHDLQSRIPETEIISHSFWRRAWAIYGHSLAISMVTVLGLFLLAILVKGCLH